MSHRPEQLLYAYERSADQDADGSVRHPVVVVGAGPVGLAAALDLAINDVPVLVLDENDRVSTGSRAICFAKRSLEILDRLGCGAAVVEQGVIWDTGRVFFGTEETYRFNLLQESDHKNPAFVNLQQYALEEIMLTRLRELQAAGAPVELRGCNKLTHLSDKGDHVLLEIDTPDGAYGLECDWLIACDGANSTARRQLGLGFTGQVFNDNFLIADVHMQADFPSERWFWFDPPFNPGQSALLHKQPGNIWRIDFQLGADIDREHEQKPENVVPRLRAMLGENAEFTLEWVSIYTFQCRRMEKFRHGRVLFAGDAAHQVSPFGARGANSGFQDVDNLIWKLREVLVGEAPDTLLDSYSDERVVAADENILNSTRSTDFITPKSEISREFRDAVLSLAKIFEFARPMVNSGRLSVPCTYDISVLNTPDTAGFPAQTRPGCAAPDAPTPKGWLLDRLGNQFQLLAIGGVVSDASTDIDIVTLDPATCPQLAERYLGAAKSAFYLLRPDQHIVARWHEFDKSAILAAIATANGHLRSAE